MTLTEAFANVTRDGYSALNHDENKRNIFVRGFKGIGPPFTHPRRAHAAALPARAGRVLVRLTFGATAFESTKAEGDELTDSEPLFKEIYIKASPEEVFSFLSEHDKFLRWMGRALEIDARPGGIFRLDPNGKEMVRGEFLEVDRPHRIVFSWGFEKGDMDVAPGSTIVEITLTPDGDGTMLRLMHRDLPRDGDVRPRHQAGWTHHLGRLQIVAEGGDAGSDPCDSREPNVSKSS